MLKSELWFALWMVLVPGSHVIVYNFISILSGSLRAVTQSVNIEFRIQQFVNSQQHPNEMATHPCHWGKGPSKFYTHDEHYRSRFLPLRVPEWPFCFVKPLSTHMSTHMST
jgi:hypothetical protein